MTTIQDLASTYSDMYKDAHGFRPQYTGHENWTVEQYESAIDSLGSLIEIQIEEEEARQKANSVRFEDRILNTIAIGASDRATAIRWIHEAEHTDGDNDYLCFVLDLPYGYIK